jgi:hypothetical protein
MRRGLYIGWGIDAFCKEPGFELESSLVNDQLIGDFNSY